MPAGPSHRLRYLAFTALAVAGVALAACGAPRFEARTVEHGRLFQRNGMWVLELRGTPAERGRAEGRLVGKQIRWALPRYLDATLHMERPRGYPLRIVRELEGSIPKDALAEIGAIAKSAHVDRDTLVLVNLAPEEVAGLSCSCMAATGKKSGTGATLLARNLDWYGGDVLKDVGLVVVESGSGEPYASLGYPGLVGVVTGMNRSGLSVANLVVLHQHARPHEGVPVTFALRAILEHQTSVDAAVSYLKALPRTVPQNYAFADPTKAVVLETARHRFRRRDPAGGFVAVANLFDEDRHTRRNSRFARMMHAGAQRSLDVAKLEKALRRVALGDMNVQSVVFEPKRRLLHASMHSRPAADGPFHTVDVGRLLGASAGVHQATR